MSGAVFGSVTLFGIEVVKDGILFNLNWMGFLSIYCGIKLCQWLFLQEPWTIPDNRRKDTVINLYNYVNENEADSEVNGSPVPKFYEQEDEECSPTGLKDYLEEKDRVDLYRKWNNK
jgi:hypothetical protein